MLSLEQLPAGRRTTGAIARSILRRPRGSSSEETARVVFLAAVPGALLSPLTALAVLAVDASGPATLLVPVPPAGAGTVALATCGAAVAVRARSIETKSPTA